MKSLKRILFLLGGLIGVVILAFVALLTFLYVQHAQVVTLPAPTGQYRVGRVIYDWTDSARQETLANTNAPRELRVDVWYPTDAPATKEFAEYMPTAWRNARENQLSLPGQFLTQDLSAVRTNSIADAPLSNSEPSYPLVVFMPGLGPLASDYTALAEDLASHGYVVAAPTPTYSASIVVFKDGRVAEGTRAGNVDDNATYEEAQQTLKQLILVWAGDAEFVRNQFEQLNQSDAATRFTGRVDFQHVGIAGHSFGGATAAQVLTHSTAFQAGANLDGYLYGDASQLGFDHPFMTIWSGTTDDPSWVQAEPDVAALYAKIPHDAYQLKIHGAQHFNFTDSAVEFSPFLKLRGALGTIDGARGLQITRAYLVAFLNRYLKGTDAPLLHGASAEFPEIEFIPR